MDGNYFKMHWHYLNPCQDGFYCTMISYTSIIFICVYVCTGMHIVLAHSAIVEKISKFANLLKN